MKAEYIFNIDKIPNENSCLLGVVITINRRWNKQRHCGIAFNLQEEPRVLHLATHNEVQCNKNLNGFLCWIKPEIHPVLQQAFCTYLEVLSEAVEKGQNNIPYGFLYDDYARIEPDGTLILAGQECGLTCATFVLTLFHSQGFDLVDLNSWNSRDEDRQWFYQIISFLKDNFFKKGRMSLYHLRRLFSEVGCPRFRPEEIAVSSALYNQQPASTTDIRQAGSGLLDYLLEIT